MTSDIVILDPPKYIFNIEAEMFVPRSALTVENNNNMPVQILADIL